MARSTKQIVFGHCAVTLGMAVLTAGQLTGCRSAPSPTPAAAEPIPAGEYTEPLPILPAPPDDGPRLITPRSASMPLEPLPDPGISAVAANRDRLTGYGPHSTSCGHSGFDPVLEPPEARQQVMPQPLQSEPGTFSGMGRRLRVAMPDQWFRRR